MATDQQSVTDLAMLPIDSLRFDPRNPRLPPSVDADDDDAILRWMLGDSSLFDLMRSIGQDGYFSGEPILVARTWEDHPTYDGSFLVVEGNRRLAAVRLLNDPERAPRRQASVSTIATESVQIPDVIPAIVYETRLEVLERLGFRHITGIKEWDTIAKARFLRQLLGAPPTLPADRHDKLRFLASRVGAGNRTDYVRRLLNGLALFDYADERQFWDLPGVTEETVHFSLLTTAIGYQNIAKWIGLKPDDHLVPNGFNETNTRHLFEWMYAPTGPNRQPVVPESRDLRTLAAIVERDRAVEVLIETGSLNKAKLLTGEPIESYRKAMEDATTSLQLALRELSSALEPTSADDLTQAQETQQVVRSIVRLVESNLEPSDVEP